jgi:hypothetical protein
MCLVALVRDVQPEPVVFAPQLPEGMRCRFGVDTIPIVLGP